MELTEEQRKEFNKKRVTAIAYIIGGALFLATVMRDNVNYSHAVLAYVGGALTVFGIFKFEENQKQKKKNLETKTA